MARNLRSELSAFFKRFFGEASASVSIQWRSDKRSDGRTALKLILHEKVPGPAFRADSVRRYTVTSEHHRLRESRFGDETKRLNDVGQKAHGRTLTCLSPGGEPLAAISFHLPTDTDTPILITAIGVLDSLHGARESEMSQAMALVLLSYLSLAAQRHGNPERLGFAPSPSGRALAARLGFRFAGAPTAYASAPGRYLEWRPPKKV